MATTMDNLPDEVIVEICGHLLPEQLLYRTFEADEMYEEHLTVTEFYAALLALCLTSKRLGNIATPQLYANLITDEEAAKSISRLAGFMTAVLQDPQLGLHLTYINHDFDDNAYLNSC